MTLTDQHMKMLRAPYTVAAVKFRPLEKPNDKGVVGCLVYIDSRLAAERLSAVDPAWSSAYEVLAGPDQHMPVVCRLTVHGVTREGVGQNASSQKDEKHAKTAFSDALKRAAVEFGVGASLYSMPRFAVEQNGYWIGKNGKVGGLKAAGITVLRSAYTRAVTDQAFLSRYGTAIDHGDYLLPDEDAAGVPDVTPGQEAAADASLLSEAQVECIAAIMEAAGHTPDLSDKLAEDYATHVTAALKYAVKQNVVAADSAQDVEAAALALDVAKVHAELGAVAA